MRAVRNLNYKQKPNMKHGEIEAKSLKRRRMIRNVTNGVSVLGLCLIFIGSVYLWQSGYVAVWFQSAENKVEDSLVDAGFVIAELQIEGNTQTNLQDLEKVIGVSDGQSLLAVDMMEIKQRVEQLNWIKTANVTRKFPDNLVINLIEHEAAALWQIENKLWVLSNEGIKITDENLENFSQLPMISGVGADAALEELINVATANHELFAKVETASWIGQRRWDLIFKNGIKIMLPEKNIKMAWQKLIEFEKEEQLLARNILTVDFRLEGKTVFRLTPEEAARRQLLAKTSGEGEEI